jgi:phenylalanyl-tRNA synthetase beta chain
VLFELELDAVLARRVPAFQTVPKHQAVERDIAVIVAEGVTHAALMAAIHAAPTNGLLREAVLFDVYRPKAGSTAAGAGGLNPGEKSLTVRLQLSDEQATLTDEQIDTAVSAILAKLVSDVGARLRA